MLTFIFAIIFGIGFFGVMMAVLVCTPLGAGIVSLGILHQMRRENLIIELRKLRIHPLLTLWLFGAALCATVSLTLLFVCKVLALIITLNRPYYIEEDPGIPYREEQTNQISEEAFRHLSQKYERKVSPNEL